jgi:hypothetical protein
VLSLCAIGGIHATGEIMIDNIDDNNDDDNNNNDSLHNTKGVPSCCPTGAGLSFNTILLSNQHHSNTILTQF